MHFTNNVVNSSCRCRHKKATPLGTVHLTTFNNIYDQMLERKRWTSTGSLSAINYWNNHGPDVSNI